MASPDGATDSTESAPQAFAEGFTWRTALGGLFVALLMIPGGIYLGMAAGWGVGDAAEWVTIVLFAEVCRRSFTPLRKQEIYILFYIAASLTTVVNQARGLGGGPFSQLVWNAYFMTTEAARPMVSQIPAWAAPPPDSAAIVERSLWHPAWWTPIAILVATDLCGRLSWMSMGYALFRVTRDVEKLPFPMAPVAASGAMALADAGTESWRWRVFSTGAAIGLAFGAVYLGLPIISGAMLGKPISLLPIPFADFTIGVESFLPAAIVGISLSLGNVLVGFVLPFEIVLGAAISSVVAMIVMNPILYHAGLLPSYRFGSNAFITKISVDMDFWLSIGIGVNVAIAILGIGLMAKAFSQARRQRQERHWSLAPPVGRGDVAMVWPIMVWIGSTAALVGLCGWLVPGFPVWILLVFGFLWTPLNSYVSARMHGLTGRGVGIPYLREATVVGSGYGRPDIWYAPVPLFDQGWAAQRFREVELTETQFTSVLKAEAFMFPLIIIASFAFWSFFWHGSALPNSQFPYAQKMWPPEATMQAAMMQVNAKSDGGWFMSALKPPLIGAGAGAGLLLYGLFSLIKAPMLFFYGFAGGIGLFPANTVPQLLGAWLGRRYFARRYGEEEWSRFAPVLLAGFSCGAGLIAMGSIAFSILARAVSPGPY